MVEPMTDNEAPAVAPRSLFANMRALPAIVTGGLALAGWVAFLAAGMLGVEEAVSRLLADVLLALAVLAAAGAFWSRVMKFAIPAGLAAVVFGVSWYALGGITYSIADALYYTLVIAFYLSVPVAGVCAMLAGRSAS